MTTLGQPLEVVKTQMASQRGDTMSQALKKVWSRGGVLGCESRRLPIALRSLEVSIQSSSLSESPALPPLLFANGVKPSG